MTAEVMIPRQENVSKLDQANASSIKLHAKEGNGIYMGGGSALMSILALMNLQQTMLKSLREWGDFSAEAMKTQMDMGKAAGQAVKDAAIAAGVSSIVAGAVSLATAAGTGFIGNRGTSKMKEYSGQMGQVESELSPVSANVKHLSGIEDETNLIVSNQPGMREEDVREHLEGLSPERIGAERLEEHADIDQLELAKNSPELKKDFDKLYEKWQKKEEILEKKRNTLSNNHSSAQNKLNMITQALNSTGNTSGQISQASGQIIKGDADKENQIKSTVAQQDGAIASQQSQAANKAAQAAENVDNLLNQIKRSEIQA
jgi:hypothetical protein